MTPRQSVAAVAGVAVLAVGGFAVADQTGISPLSATATTTLQVPPSEPPACEDYGGIPMDSHACFAAGAIRNVSLVNLQGAAQFCKWRDANPGEWSRLKGYASTGTPPTNIITWMGAHIQNDLEAYFATGAPPMDDKTTFPIESIPPNTAPNVCRSPLPPPKVTGVTPGQTDATVTVTTTP